MNQLRSSINELALMSHSEWHMLVDGMAGRI